MKTTKKPPKGGAHWNAKTDEKTREAIRRSKRSDSALAAQYRIHVTTVWRIRRETRKEKR